MKKLLFGFLIFALAIPHFLSAQLVNEGATIIVQSGAVLTVNADVQNNSGTLELAGTALLKVKKDLFNGASATLTTAAGSTIECVGSTPTNITSAGNGIATLKVNKDANVDVLLSDDLTVSNGIEFAADDNKLVIGTNNLTLEDAATVSGQSAIRYVQADGTGKMVKNYTGMGSFDYPVGDVNDYSPVSVSTTAGSFGASASIGVNVTDADHPNKLMDADAWISRYWTADVTDITGLEGSIVGTYVDGDINGTESSLSGAAYYGADWHFDGSAGDDVANTVTADLTQDMDLTGQNFFGKFTDLKVFLQGPYSGGTMKTDLNSGGYLPLNTPYGTGESVGSIPNADIVDWIKLELRDKMDNTSVLKEYSVFVDKNSQVVDLDGNQTIWLKDAPQEAFVAVRHRNHLGIMTPTSQVLSSGATYDFTSGSGQAWGTDPMKDLGSGNWGMWMGNANGNNNVKYNGGSNDKVKILVKVGFSTPNNTVSGYLDEDINMDGDVKYNGAGNDKVKVLLVVGFSTPNNIRTEQLP